MIQPQALVLIDIINQGQYKRIVEIGCLEGETAFHIGKSCESMATYYMVDPWRVCTGEGTGKLARISQDRWDQIYASVCKRFQGDSRFEILRMTSLQASRLFIPEILDVVFIDAIHSYEEVKADIKRWLPLIKQDGVLCGDDYYSKYPGVKQAVDEVLGDSVEFSLKKRVWIHRKIKS